MADNQLYVVPTEYGLVIADKDQSVLYMYGKDFQDKDLKLVCFGKSPDELKAFMDLKPGDKLGINRESKEDTYLHAPVAQDSPVLVPETELRSLIMEAGLENII